MIDYHSETSAAEFILKGISVLITNEGTGIWRLRSKTDNTFDERGAAQTLACDLGEEIKLSALPINTGEQDGRLKISASDGSYVLADSDSIGFYSSDGVLKRKVSGICCEGNSCFVTVDAFPDERLYGTGERFDRVNQRNKKLNLYAVDRWCQTRGNSYLPVPVLLSSRSDMVFMNRYEQSLFDICSSQKNKIKIEQKYAPADLYFFISDSAADNLASYCRLTGFAPLPPEWSFGTLVCRYHPEFYTKEGVFSMIDEMEKNGFPWSAVILEGFRPYQVEKLPELREICDRVHSLGKKVMLYEQCGRFPKDADKLFGLDDSYAVSSDGGVELDETSSYNKLDNLNKKKMRCIDLTSQRSREKWFDYWSGYIDDIGIDGAKIDFCEQFPDRPDIKFADGRSPMGAHHWFPTLYNILQFNHFNSKPQGGVNFSRGGGIGAQRYPFVWAGDQRREFYFLKPVVRAALSLGLSGVPFVSWDMAGYQPSFNPVDKRQENRVFIRGLEFTAFSAVIQTHGRVKRPYDFDDHTKDVYRAYSNLHECLRPYIIEQAEISCKTGLPLMRHLFLYDSADKNCFDIEDEYMLGDSLLIAPVLGRWNSRNIYLPEGKWINIFDGREYEGGRWLKHYKVPLESVPVFRPAGKVTGCLDDVLEKASPYIKEINKLS